MFERASMRISLKNLGLQNMKKWCGYCHSYGKLFKRSWTYDEKYWSSNKKTRLKKRWSLKLDQIISDESFPKVLTFLVVGKL